MGKRLNVGCGQTPTTGFINYDNSWSIRIARGGLRSLIPSMLFDEHQRNFMAYAERADIRWANVTDRIPEPDASVEVLYSSHMLEHLDRDQAALFIREARRVLMPGGIIRLAVPDLSLYVQQYLEHKDADKLVDATYLARPGLKTVTDKLKYLLVGTRHHQWMYDGASLCRLLSNLGFHNAQVMEPGTTLIREPGELNLRERETESVFVEAFKP